MDRERQKKLITAAYTLAYEAFTDVKDSDGNHVIVYANEDDCIYPAIGPMAAEIYRNMNRLMIVNVKSRNRTHLRAVADNLKAMDVPPAIVCGQEFDFAMIDEATLIPDEALEALETIAERIRQRKYAPSPDDSEGSPLTIVLSSDTIWCPECKFTFLADVTMGEYDPFPTHVAHCPDCNYIIGESDWNVIYSDPVIIQKMEKFERALLATYNRVAEKSGDNIPIYTVLLNTAGHPDGRAVIQGDIVYPIGEHQMVIAVNKDGVEHLVMDGVGIELESLSLDQLLIYYTSIGFMLHDMSLLKPVEEEEEWIHRDAVTQMLREYEKDMIDAFKKATDERTWEVFCFVIDTPTAQIVRWVGQAVAFPVEIEEFVIRVEQEKIIRYSYDMKQMALEGMPVDQLRAYHHLSKAMIAAVSGEELPDWANANVPPEEEEGESHEGEEAKRSP